MELLRRVGRGGAAGVGQLRAAGRPGGRGTIVAVLDSGVSYRDDPPYRLSPELARSQFVRGYDFLGRDRRPHDTSGHGTHIASIIAQRRNSETGLTGLAYGTRIMPIRVLDSEDAGDAADIARGVRFATSRGVDVINLSMKFDARTRARDIPSLIEALAYARRRGVVVVAAAGNEGRSRVPYPARHWTTIAVGATTISTCGAEYSNYGSRIDLVAPGGGDDADVPGDLSCEPSTGGRPEIVQTSFDGNPRRFGPRSRDGTSMSAPHVAAAAAPRGWCSTPSRRRRDAAAPRAIAALRRTEVTDPSTSESRGSRAARPSRAASSGRRGSSASRRKARCSRPRAAGRG